jgi:hypothetical protein
VIRGGGAGGPRTARRDPDGPDPAAAAKAKAENDGKGGPTP